MDPVPKLRPGVQDHLASSAGEFLDLLSPRHELWGFDPTPWIYRGQANADWRLVPTAARDRAAFRQFAIAASFLGAGQADWEKRRTFVLWALEAFRQGLDDSGISIPIDAPTVTQSEKRGSNAHPEREVWPLMALAQHHEIPTLFLDWTRRAWVAAYFATSSYLNGVDNPGTHLAVWALKRPSRLEEALTTLPSSRPEFYVPPSSTNPNLRAQSGLFTIYTTENDSTLDAYYGEHSEDPGALHRLVVPTSHAKELLRLLSYEGISAASMFPDANGVVRAMRERALWDHPVPITERG